MKSSNPTRRNLQAIEALEKPQLVEDPVNPEANSIGNKEG